MEKLFKLTESSALLIFLSALGIYLSVIVFTRICGKRSFSKMSSFDFAMTVAVGSIIATTVLSPSVSLTQGLLGMASVYILQIAAALLRRNNTLKNLMDNSPLLLMDGEEILTQNLKKARVAESDLRAKLREHNVTELSKIKAVVFETTGSISVLYNENNAFDLWLMEDVKRD